MEIPAKAEEAIPNRLMAFGIDWVVLAILSAIIWFVFWILRSVLLLGGAASGGAAADGAGILSILLSFVQWGLIAAVLLAYFVLFQTRSGQTLGMNLLDVTVVTLDGSSISTRQALIRNVVLLAPLPFMAISSIIVPILGFPIAVGMMAAWLFVELAAMFVLGEGQRIGDKAAGTFVVETLVTEDVAGTPDGSTRPADA
ncbi:RDD family protein [Haloarchaeobius litoreus]|uniref:RDD family protein n=1 Tax=Haloarchaeobius litoreus TaxID=755306 RepID=A0ABD6DHF2_9EURY|nr:RDD family protein [Haloarchaeobius litoreus]